MMVLENQEAYRPDQGKPIVDAYSKKQFLNLLINTEERNEDEVRDLVRRVEDLGQYSFIVLLNEPVDLGIVASTYELVHNNSFPNYQVNVSPAISLETRPEHFFFNSHLITLKNKSFFNGTSKGAKRGVGSLNNFRGFLLRDLEHDDNDYVYSNPEGSTVRHAVFDNYDAERSLVETTYKTLKTLSNPDRDKEDFHTITFREGFGFNLRDNVPQ